MGSIPERLQQWRYPKVTLLPRIYANRSLATSCCQGFTKHLEPGTIFIGIVVDVHGESIRARPEGFIASNPKDRLIAINNQASTGSP